MNGSTEATSILDLHAPEVAALVELTATANAVLDPRAYLVEAHRAISAQIAPAYALNDRQPASRTVRRGRGSCSQRLAVLEAMARRAGIATRVHGIAADGSFWYPRFPRLGFLVPERVILAWPEFLISGTWVSVSELFGSLGEMAACGVGFTNQGGETFFEAVARTAVDWEGVTQSPRCDLSAHVREDLGRYDSRDDLFDAHGQTLNWLARTVGDPIMRRRTISH